MAIGQQKRCSVCRQTKPVAEFPKNKSTPDGYNSSCRPCCNARQRAWHRANPEKSKQQRQVWAGKIKTTKKHQTKRRLDNQKNYARRGKEARRVYKARLFGEVLKHYGPFCACCGECDPLFLTVDHINNDGAEHRRQLGWLRGNRYSLSAADLHCWLRQNSFPSGFQILCFNCNCGKARNDGVCPHSEQRRTVALL